MKPPAAATLPRVPIPIYTIQGRVLPGHSESQMQAQVIQGVVLPQKPHTGRMEPIGEEEKSSTGAISGAAQDSTCFHGGLWTAHYPQGLSHLSAKQTGFCGTSVCVYGQGRTGSPGAIPWRSQVSLSCLVQGCWVWDLRASKGSSLLEHSWSSFKTLIPC